MQLVGKLLVQCQARAPRHGFRFKNTLYSLDASTVDLCLGVFPWVKFRIFAIDHGYTDYA
ncbi:hypothetical protein BW247_09790 [Acidihalobacter ferrooxydans]|uniref:Uncharacterized protein n=1 Tax=Acidihalobacter ferrooxydans TaxID=1765967 RepID=A0A1P8UHM9_9GAMM|nr:hypothetical protein BW247_09790 [Acidihalobacter ferrooxydans]